MPTQGTTAPQLTDSDLAQLMAAGNQDGLRCFLAQYGAVVRHYLARRYGTALQEHEIEEAFSGAVFNVWRFAARYDSRRASLVAWSIRIAQRAAQSILRRELKYRAKHLEYAVEYDPAEWPAEAPHLAQSPEREGLVNALAEAVQKLPPLQKAIILADLAAGSSGVADAGRLAELHKTDTNSIYVSRLKAKQNLRKELAHQGLLPKN